MKYKIGDIVEVRKPFNDAIFIGRILEYHMDGYNVIPIDNNHGLTHSNWIYNGYHWTGDAHIVRMATLMPDDLFTI